MKQNKKLLEAAARFKELKAQMDSLESQIKPVKQMLVEAAKGADLDSLTIGDVTVVRKAAIRYTINPNKITPVWLSAIHDGGLFHTLNVSINAKNAGDITPIEKDCFFDEVEFTEKESVTFAVIS